MNRTLRDTVVSLVMLVGAGMFPGEAAACRFLQFPASARNEADAGVVVELVSVVPVGDQTRFTTWRAIGQTREVVFGQPESDDVEFGGAYSSSGCGGGLPPIGDLWVLYLDRAEGQDRVAAWYPLVRAIELDTRIAASRTAAAD